MFICSVANRCVYINPYWMGYTNIYRVIGNILLAISHAIYRVGDNRRNVNASAVRIFLISWRQKTRDIYYVDLSSWYEIWFAIICIVWTSIWIFLPRYNSFKDGFNCQSVGQHRLIEKLRLMKCNEREYSGCICTILTVVIQEYFLSKPAPGSATVRWLFELYVLAVCYAMKSSRLVWSI